MNGEPTYEFDIPNGRTKLKELILHIAKECCDDPTFGATKLNKILWWADFLFYRATGPSDYWSRISEASEWPCST